MATNVYNRLTQHQKIILYKEIHKHIAIYFPLNIHKVCNSYITVTYGQKERKHKKVRERIQLEQMGLIWVTFLPINEKGNEEQCRIYIVYSLHFTPLLY